MPICHTWRFSRLWEQPREANAPWSLTEPSMIKPKHDLLWHRPGPSRAPAGITLEELLVLLTLAAEVEHALLVQYLYAAGSLDVQGSTGTQQLREMIRAVALQEMAHFI